MSPTVETGTVETGGGPMTPLQFKRARQALRLSVEQMAVMLGVEPLHIRRMETDPKVRSHRPVRPATERLLRAYLDGYRPPDWGAIPEQRLVKKQEAFERWQDNKRQRSEIDTTPT
jgi:transcriptional regulator with XRE-family HTH domain